MDFEDGKFYRLQVVADAMGIPKPSLAAWARSGQVKAVKLGRDWHMTGEAVKELMTHGTIETKDRE